MNEDAITALFKFINKTINLLEITSYELSTQLCSEFMESKSIYKQF